MQYQLAFGFFIGQKPNGWTNLLLATVCLFIPVVGPLVLLGYQAEMAERLVRDPDLRRYPDFSFDRFVELLTRGLWPFLLSLIAALVFIPVLIAAVFAAVAVGAAANSPGVGAALAVAVYFFGIIGVNAIMIPVQFYAEMANRFDLGGAVRFTLSFMKLVGGRAVVALLVLMLLTVPLLFLGMLACFVGVYPASIVGMMAGQHLMVQLYLDYLDRGGEEIVKTPTDAERRRRRRREEDEEDELYDDER
ncbi:DUF4013 domain-containing protein [Urbifossiella limnaea]|uniref:DUF4013 domain-containing protein n=1 Tax=Urbifossiella limnaea TaxID=2528023 RepID=UPI00192E6031|nr:DUF4013 domain-containing protein [Urbifossiella limnaea]